MNPPNDLKPRVAQFLAEEAAPFLKMDGSQVELLDIQDGIARFRLNRPPGTDPLWLWLLAGGLVAAVGGRGSRLLPVGLAGKHGCGYRHGSPASPFLCPAVDEWRSQPNGHF